MASIGNSLKSGFEWFFVHYRNNNEKHFESRRRKDLFPLFFTRAESWRNWNPLWNPLRHFSLLVFFLSLMASCKQKGRTECAETGSASCRRVSRESLFLRHNLVPANDSLTRLNVKSTLLRWLNLWSVLLDGMFKVGRRDCWHLQEKCFWWN